MKVNMPWKLILLNVKARRKLEDKSMGYVVHATNMQSQESKHLLIGKQLIEEQDIAGIEKVLAQKVELAESDAQIYIQISEKMLAKKAKQV